MTAIQILSRRTPKIDDFKGQIIETLMQLSVASTEINQKLHTLLSSCVQYDPEIHPNQLRPTAEVVSREIVEILDILGGDPRDNNGHIDPEMKELEEIARRREAERLKTTISSPRNGIFRPQSGNLSLNRKAFEQMSSKSKSMDRSSPSSFRHSTSSYAIQQQHDYNDAAITTYSTGEGLNQTNMYDSPLGSPMGGSPVQQHYSFRSSYDNTNVGGDNASSIYGSYPSQDDEDKNMLMTFLRHKVNCTSADCILIADMLIKNGVANIDVLKRRLLRNDEFLLDLGIEDNVADDIYREVVTKSSGPTHGFGSMGSFSTKLGSVHSNNSNKRRNGSFFLTSDVLPTEVSRLYYDAAQCNRTEALDKLQEIADKGDKLAECFLMRMYALGQGNIKKDSIVAHEMGNRLLPWLKDAIDSGNDMYLMYARYLIGVCYSEGLGTNQDQREAVRWCRQSAEQGYAAAQAYLGFCFFAGNGVPRNLEDAVRWYRMSADQGYAGAQCNLGLCFEHGYGVKPNAEEAVKWYRLSADQGDAAALFNLGYCYEKGLGVAEDSYDAVRYYKLAAGYGYIAAQYNLGVCYYFGNGVEQNMEEAVTWYRIAADKEYAPAQCNLGLCYENGHGIEKDYIEAVYWYRQASEQSHPAALYYLGFCYFSGMGVEKEISEAVKYYKLSAEKKYPPAQNNLGFCYFNGLGVVKNYSIAVKWYNAAAEQGYAPAQYNMGYCYEKGFGVVSKLHSVIRWYRLAAEQGNEKAKKALTRYQNQY
jgi:TPR repeat protein